MANSSFGGTIKLTGENEYKKALNEITSNLKLFGSELKVVTSSFDKNSQSISDLNNVNQVLTKRLDEQNKKVNETKKILEEAKAEYGENSDVTRKWQIALNDAQSDLNKTTQEINKNKKSIEDMEKANVTNTEQLKEFSKEENKAGEGTLKLGDLIKANLISEGIVAGFKGLVTVIKEVGQAFIEVGTQAVKGFADFEQLEGGVKTLFGTEAESVEDYANSVGKSVDEVQEEYNNLLSAQQQVFKDANNAYKDAGMSANEYMETVTSFSASLISSLDGDTVAAATASKQAITDMADNANKMGTDISMIQSAYQGFAKQNYTMLDNLKLGYGGTKTEMERLLSDAEKLSGQKYDISNLNDVYSAIHVVQTELGITGTTAKEASKTISGSVSAMKSSITNFVSGLANGDADLQELIDNVVESVITASENIIPAIEQTIESIMEALPELLDQISDKLPEFLEAGTDILNSLISGITQNISSITNTVLQIVSTLINAIIQNLPQILQTGIQLLTTLVQGIANQIPSLIPEMINAVMTMVDTLLDNIDLLIDAGIQLILGLADGLIKALPDLIDKIPEIIDKLILAITGNLPKLLEMGMQLIVSLAEGLIKAIPQLVSKIPELVGSLIKGLLNFVGSFVESGLNIVLKIKDGIVSGIASIPEVGKNLVEGIWNGISSSFEWIKNKIKGWVGDVLKFIKKLFGISSPSKVMKDQVGVNLAKGIGEGFEEEMTDVNNTIKNSMPTDFDISTNINANKNLGDFSSNLGLSNYTDNSSLVSSFQQALEGMAFKVDGDKIGELVINNVERVVYS